MPPTSPPLLDGILTSPPSAIPASDSFGLTLLPVGPVSVPTRSPPEVVYAELDPPAPTRILANNPTRRGVVIRLGQVVAGGMADRALTTSVTIAPRATSVVPVEPLSSRWWDAGVMRGGDELPPALSALLILAGRAGPGLRCIARTVLWTACPQRDRDLTPPRGDWVLLDGARVLALHLVRGMPALRARRAARWPAEPGGTLLRAGPGDAGGEVIRHVVSHVSGTELWLVRASLDLPDLILGAVPG